MMPCWSLHLPPRVLASGPTFSFQTLSQHPGPHRLYHCGLLYSYHARPSAPDLATIGFRRAHEWFLPLDSGNNLRQTVGTRALSAIRKHFRASEYEAIPNTPSLPRVPQNIDGEVLSTTRASRKAPFNPEGIYQSQYPTPACKIRPICETSPDFQSCHSPRTGGALQPEYVFLVLASYMMLLWIWDPLPMPSYQFKQEASIEARNEQGMDDRGGCGVRSSGCLPTIGTTRWNGIRVVF